MEKVVGWWMLWAWLGGAAAGALGVASYYVWRHEVDGIPYAILNGDNIGNSGDRILGRVLMAVVWPATLSALLIYGIGYGIGYGLGYAPFFLLPRYLIRRHVRRRERVALAEAEAKRVADEARLGAERGAHR